MQAADDGLVPPGVRPVLVASHQRSGTHLTMDLLRRQFDACRPPFRPGVNPHRYLYFSMDRFRPTHPSHVGPSACLAVLRSTSMPILKAHSLPGFPEASEEAAPLCAALMARSIRIYCVRDVRSMLASLHAFDAVDDERYAAMPLAEFIRTEINGVPRPGVWANHVEAWLDRGEPSLVLRFERVIADPAGTMDELAQALGQPPLRREPVLPRAMKHRWRIWAARLTGVPESTNVIGRRKGMAVPKWRDTLDPDDRAFIERHAGHALRRLGYEPDDAWVREGPRASHAEPGTSR